MGNEEVGEGDESKDEKEEPARLVIKEPTDKQQKDIAQMQTLPSSAPLTDNERQHREHNRKERPEIELGEEQRTIGLKCKYVMQ